MQSSQNVSPPQAGKERNSLTDFINDNQKLISVLGVFTALTVFSANLPFKIMGYALSFIFFAVTLLVWIELLEKFPKGKANWRLRLFENLLSYSVLGIFLYWLLAYREIWQVMLVFPLTILLATLFTSILILPIKRVALLQQFFALTPPRVHLLRHVLFFTISVLVLFLSFTISYRIAPPLNHILDEFHDQIEKAIPARAP